jgi:hypothetical protein
MHKTSFLWIIRYIQALSGSAWGVAFLISGFISTGMTFVSVYAPEFHLHRWILVGIALVAFFLAPARLYFQQAQRIARLESDLQEFQYSLEKAALTEEPNVLLSTRWPEDNPSNRPMKFIAINRGKLPLRSFQLQRLILDLWHVSFDAIPTLEPDVAHELEYKISGGSDDGADFLDLLMVAHSVDISPCEHILRAQLIKANGQTRQITFKLFYAPLHNPRKVNGASEVELCIVLERG